MNKKKILIVYLCSLLLYNFSLNAFASDDLITGGYHEEELFIPSVYDHSNYYSPRVGGTLALGSLGITTAGEVAVLGGLASVVGPILGAIALVGGALVVGQGLVNIYDYVSNMGLLQSDADALNTSLSLDKSGNMHLQ